MESCKSNNLDPFDMLYTAKWNVPKAAAHLGVSNEDCKLMFREFCAARWADDAEQKV